MTHYLNEYLYVHQAMAVVCNFSVLLFLQQKLTSVHIFHLCFFLCKPILLNKVSYHSYNYPIYLKKNHFLSRLYMRFHLDCTQFCLENSQHQNRTLGSCHRNRSPVKIKIYKKNIEKLKKTNFIQKYLS